MPTVSHPDLSESTVSGRCYGCPVDCDLPDMILGWLRCVRELRVDEAQLVELLALARSEWRAA